MTKCSECHRIEADRWRESTACARDGGAVAGERQGAIQGEFYAQWRTSTFSRSNDAYVVRTDGPDGVTQNFDVKYTFGVFPLQQYFAAAG